MRKLLLLLAVALLAAGCIGSQTSEDVDEASVDVPAEATDAVVELDTEAPPDLAFSEEVVDAAIGYTNDLYEPTIEVSDNGVIYVTGHTILVDTTGAPVFMSDDGGDSWEQLPFFMDAQMPAGVHGATPPPSDEIFLTAGEDGRLWGVDITLASFPVNGWCNDGAEHCYHNPDAYDEAQAQTSRAEAVSGMDESCSAANLNDRPWAAQAGDKLLMVNNPGGGPVQVGAMDVPRDTYLEGPGVGGPGPVSAEWNLCAGEGDGYIPGIPDMREDHRFAVPQVQDDQLVLVTGNAEDVNDVEQVTVTDVTNAEEQPATTNYGQAVFDDEGDLFVGIRNNTEAGEDGDRTGQIKLSASTDGGETFTTRTFRTGEPTASLYMDGNMNGPGALLSWAQVGDDGHDWYAAHVSLGEDGQPVVTNVSLALEDGPPPSAHVQGAALGPNGTAHLVMFYGGYSAADRATPIEVLVQEDGPTLPVDADVDELG
jgi:hypothetical protein